MKHVVLLGAGMADAPAAALDGRTPLAHARMPHAARIAREGRLGTASFAVPEGAGSEVGVLGALGYAPREVPARGPLEAAGRGVHLAAGEAVFRASLCTVGAGRLLDAAAGGVRPAEAAALCEALNAGLGEGAVRFVPGVGHRALMIFSGGAAEVALETRTAHPLGLLDRALADHWPQGGPAADLLRSVMERAQAILDAHEVNAVRRDLGENPANAVWLWGGGGTPLLADSFGWAGRAARHGAGPKAAVAAGVDLLRGIARLAGMTVLEVPGATGDQRTDMAAKARAALAALAKGDHDLAVVHVQAPAEAGHAGDARGKVSALERFDAEVIGPALEAAAKGGMRLLLATDHAACSDRRGHAAMPVPVALWGPGFAPRREAAGYDEDSAAASDLRFEAGHEMMEYFLRHP